MAAVILTVLLSLLCGGIGWLALGARLRIDATDSARNELLNLLAYIGLAAPVVFGIVFFVLGAV